MASKGWQMKRVRLGIPLLVIAVLIMIPAVAEGKQWNLSWFTIDGGGGACIGDEWQLQGTVGQADAVTLLSGGDFTIAGGFWDPSDPDCLNDIKAPIVICPGDITVVPDPVSCNAIVAWSPAIANDECDGVIDSVNYLIDLYDDGFVDATQDTTTYEFPAGFHRVIATAEDAQSLEGFCSFFGTVESCQLDGDLFVRPRFPILATNPFFLTVLAAVTAIAV